MTAVVQRAGRGEPAIETVPLLRVCVFSGSNRGARASYLDEARALGGLLARSGIGLVYGGAGVGLMGAVADAALDAGGEVIGVIPEALVEKEVAHPSLSDLRVVGSMHERKALMADLAGAFIAMPGGFGTFEELFEIVTWGQLGLHRKPIGLLNVDGYYDPLLELVRHAVAEGFVVPDHARLMIAAADPATLLDGLAAYQPPVVASKWWLTPEET